MNDCFITDPAVARAGGFENYGSLDDTRSWLTAHGDRIVHEVLERKDEGDDGDEADLIEARALALANRRPDLQGKLAAYVQSQRDEYAFLGEATTDAVWALERCDNG